MREQGLQLQEIAGVVAMGCRLNNKVNAGGASQEQIRRHFESDPYDAGFGSIEALNQAVPAAHVSTHMPPYLILIAEKEQVQPPILDDAKMFDAAARQAGATADYVALLGLSHLQLDPQREVRNRPDLPAYPRVGYEVNLRAAAAPFLLTPTPYRTSFEKIT